MNRRALARALESPVRHAAGVLVLAAGLARAAPAQAPERHDGLRERLQARLDSARARATFPGAVVGVVLPDGSSFALATGMSDTALRRPMRPADRLLMGSVGKTYVAALALQLVHEGRLELDAPVSRYLGREPWFGRLPNASQITVRQLMNHTSGLVRYEFDERFLRDLSARPYRVWRPEEQLAYLFDSAAPFAAGQGWDYSDTNYIVLGMIIERLTGATLYGEIQRRLLGPLGLANTVPSDGPVIAGLAQGYAGPGNPFGGADAMLVDGRFVINPQFEWAGGGFAAAAEDLARWAAAFYEGRAFDASLLPQALDGVDAPMLGRGVRYGLGVIIRENPLGPVYGHSGFFPGYITEMRYFARQRVVVVLMFNTSVPRSIGRSPGALIQDLVQLIVGPS